MAKFTDYEVRNDVSDIMETMVKSFPQVFRGFDVNQVFCVYTKDKQDFKKPLKIRPIRYPFDILATKVYIIEVADGTWKDLDQKRKNLTVFHTMCSIPEGAFDEESKYYAKVKKPDYELFAEEFSVSGGIPNWMENDSASDPMEKIERIPVTIDGIANVGS